MKNNTPGPSAGYIQNEEADSGVATMDMIEGFARPK